ncbi:MAG: Holliday junction branch migration protein RuvA [Thiobacillaceae bacterium]|nr:Holliday junction branch migration protein RuvA [Thiobacillaceae bacterium]MDW8324795.1 Holliday junction branch migration protein RuvA [Burkholderiales bacterium]
MIGRLTGTLLEKHPPQVLIDVQGVGYEVDVPMSTFCNLPGTGQQVSLLTHLVVREDAQQLYGFLTARERDAFRLLIRISGVGPKLALAVLSGLSVDELAQAVARQDGSRLTRIPGVGKKTAERLLLELKGRLADALPAAPGAAPASSGVQAEVLEALLALGYTEREAAPAVGQLPPGLSLEEAIRQALRLLAR